MINGKEYGKIIARNLRNLMHEHQKSQADVSRDLGISKATLSSWMNGTRIPKMGNIDTLCDYFGVNRSALMEYDGQTKSRTATNIQAELIKLTMTADSENVSLVLEVLKRLERAR